MFCSKCGANNPDGAKFCKGCGESLPQDASAEQQGQRAPSVTSSSGRAALIKRKWSRSLFIIGAALAFAIALAAVFVIVPTLHKSPFKDAKVGDVVQFGSYEQDDDASDGKEPIEWRVLAVEGERAYVVSEKALSARAFNYKVDKSNDWGSSDLKAWLADDFASEAFSDEERKDIDGDPTLLSVDEVSQYFQSCDERVCYPTQRAVTAGARTVNSGACFWWLRSPGVGSFWAAYVNAGGYVFSGTSVVDSAGAVRPALWVKL